MKITTNKKVNEKLSFAIFIQFTVLTIQYLIIHLLNLGGSNIEPLIKISSKLIVGLFFIRALIDIYYREYKTIIIVYIFFVTVFLLHIMLYPQNTKEIILISFDFFAMCLPCFVYSLSIDNYDVLFNSFRKNGNIIFALGIFMSYMILFRNLNIGKNYSMSLSYYMLIPSLIYIYDFLNTYSFTKLLLFIFSTVGILLIGARGPILCIGVYITVYIITNIRGFNSRGRLVFYITSIFVLIISLTFLNNIIVIISRILKDFNISSRTVEILLSDINYLSGREKLYSGAFSLIKQHPFLGIGIAGDRVYFNGYIHNLFLELILNYGIILGFLICLFLLYIFVKSIIFVDKKTSNFNLLFLCLGIVPLMLSSSYLINTWFWIYLGLALKTIFKSNYYIS